MGVRFHSDRMMMYPAKIFKASQPFDVALLEIPKPKNGVSRNKNWVISKHDRGDEVWFIGKGREWFIPVRPGFIITAADGIDRKLTADLKDVQVGTSGAPLFTADGIIGMVIIDDQNQVEAVDINAIKQLVIKWGVPWQLRDFYAARIYDCELSNDIAMISIEGDYFNRPKSWREGWANLIRMLSRARASMVVFDVILRGESDYDEDLINAIKEAEMTMGILFVKEEENSFEQKLQTVPEEDLAYNRLDFGFSCRGRMELNSDGTGNFLSLPILLERKPDQFWVREDSIMFKAVDRYLQIMNLGWLDFDKSGKTPLIMKESMDEDSVTAPSIELSVQTIEWTSGCSFMKIGDFIYNISLSLAPIDRLKTKKNRHFFYSLEKNKIYNSAYDQHPSGGMMANLFGGKLVIIGVLDSDRDILEDGKHFGIDSLAAGINALLMCGPTTNE